MNGMALFVVALGLATSRISSAALAQGLPSEGEFAITFGLVNLVPLSPHRIEGDRRVLINPSIAVATNDAGQGLLHGAVGRCLSFTTIDADMRVTDVHGYCGYADASGDQIFEHFISPVPPKPGQALELSGRLVGGTGKYAGLTGEFEMIASGKVKADGLNPGIGKKTGHYRIAK
jgi:hypothetical protein